MKKMMLLALAAASVAMFALPAAASANFWHLDATSSFTVHSNTPGQLQTTSGSAVECTSTTGDGSFTTTTTGTLNLVFHGCKNVGLGVACTTAGQPSGTIAASGLEFHAADVEHEVSKKTGTGVLITPPPAASIETSSPTRRLFAAFSCFGIPVRVIGNGIIGTITSPACNTPSTEATLSFSSTGVAGHQTHRVWTGTSYDLESSLAGGNHSTASMNAHATITFPQPRTIECTT